MAPPAPTLNETVYILLNESFPGLVKIGRTDRTAEDRIAELFAATGVPTPFTIWRSYPVSNSVLVERAVHERLAEYRVHKGREFFRVDPEIAHEVIMSLIDQDLSKQSNPDEEDRLMAAATEYCQRNDLVWPSALCGELGISLDAAESILRALVGRGVINEQGEVNLAYRLPPTTEELARTPAGRHRLARVEADSRFREALVAAGMNLQPDGSVYANLPNAKGEYVVSLSKSEWYARNTGDSLETILRRRFVKSGTLDVPVEPAEPVPLLKVILIGAAIAFGIWMVATGAGVALIGIGLGVGVALYFARRHHTG